MASMPMDQENGARRTGGKPPVSAHPAFPAIVALWFAALLGLGSLILPVQLIERLVSATGLAALVPAAAPPLGFTARAAIALAATIFGALLGVVAAKRVAGASRKHHGVHEDMSADRRAFSAHDEIEEDGIEGEEFYPDADYAPDEEASQRKRRRALAMQEDEGPSEFLAVAPLPGVEEHDAGLDLIDDTLELAEEIEFTGEFDPDAPAPEAVEEAPADHARQEFAAPEKTDEPVAEPQRFAFKDRSVNAEPLAFSPPSMARQSAPESAPGDAAPARPFDAPPPGNEDAAPARPFDAPPPGNEAAQPKPEFTEEPEENPVSEKQTFQPAVPQPFEAPSEVTDSAAAPPAEPVEPQEDGVGLVQLVQKLGSALEKHREWSAQRAAGTTAPATAAPFAAPAAVASATEAAAAIPQEFEAARPDDAAEAMAAYFSKPADSDAAAVEEESGEGAEDFSSPPPVPGQQFAPLAENVRITDDHADDDDEDEIADLAASFSLPLARSGSQVPESVTPTPRPSFDIAPLGAAAAPQNAEDEDPEEEEDSPQSDAAYSSLSQVSNPFRQKAQEFVRIEEPEPEADSHQPAVVFPHEEARKPAPAPAPEATEGNVARPFDRPADAPAPQRERQSANNDDNERALREALMNLQRMGK